MPALGSTWMLALGALIAAGCTEAAGAGGDAAGGAGAAGAVAAGGAAGGPSDGGFGGSAGDGGAPPSEPEFDAIPWSVGDDVGLGVAFKDTQNPGGEAVFIGYAGYGIGLEASEAWVRELYRATLRERGVRYVYAVQGPADVGYAGLEIGNSKIAGWLGEHVSDASAFVLVAAHSSGSYVAHELLGQLAGGLDPGGVTDGKVVYFDLDGGQSGLSAASVARLRRAFFVGAVDATSGTSSPNIGSMQSAGALYADKGGYLELDVSGSGCNVGASWCLHMTLITTVPHDPDAASGTADYSDFERRPVAHAYIDREASAAGL